MKHCKKCKRSIKEGVVFCPYCGHTIISEPRGGKRSFVVTTIIIATLILVVTAVIIIVIKPNKGQKQIFSSTTLETPDNERLIYNNQSRASSTETASPHKIVPDAYIVYDTYKDKKDPYLNLRTGPATSYSIIKKLSDGEKVEVIERGRGTDGKWFKIYYRTGNISGYVHSRYLKKAE